MNDEGTMEAPILERFRNAISQRRDNLLDWLRSTPPEQRILTRNGRTRDVLTEETSVVADASRALEQMEHGTFGRCLICHGEIESDRLELDFTTSICLDCYEASELRALERDLEMAALVQQELFPREVPALRGVQIAAHAMPGRIVSGDYYDFFRFQNGAQGIVVADVMGAGLPASILMSNLQASLRIIASQYESPDRLVARLNELYRYNLKLIRFISMFILSIDPDRRNISFTNAGHQPPLLWKAGSTTHTWLKPTCPAIGIVPDATFSCTTLDATPGDILVLFTDGLVEARNHSGVSFDEEGLSAFVRDHHELSAEEILAGLWRNVKHFSGGRMADDAALLVVKFD